MSKTFDISCEVRGIAAVLTELKTNGIEGLTSSTLVEIFYGLSSHLSRIADDLENMDGAVEAAE